MTRHCEQICGDRSGSGRVYSGGWCGFRDDILAGLREPLETAERWVERVQGRGGLLSAYALRTFRAAGCRDGITNLTGLKNGEGEGEGN